MREEFANKPEEKEDCFFRGKVWAKTRRLLRR